VTTVDVEPNGVIQLPDTVLEESRIQPGAQVVVIAHEGRIVLLDRERFRSQVEAPVEKLLQRFRDVMERAPGAPFIDGLTFEEYAALSDEDEQALWDRLSAEAARKVRTVEQEIPAHFRPARQEPGGYGDRREKGG